MTVEAKMETEFQNLVDRIEAASCVVSVQVLEDGTCGEIRIVAGNKGYVDPIERPAGDYGMRGNRFIPGSLYTDYVPRDLNFEDYCFRSAVNKKCLNSYVKPSQMPVWFNMTFLPIGPSRGNQHYCIYTMEVNFEANTERMTSIAAGLANEVLETCIKIRGAADFQAAMDDIIEDIRNLCKAEHCCILLMDSYEKSCRKFCEAFAPNSSVPTSDEEDLKKFYMIAASWEGLIGSSNCLIAKNDKDMQLVEERNPTWCDTLRKNNIRNIVLFPLKSHDELLGYIWAINFDADQAPKIKDTLELTSFILGSEIANYLLLDRLRILSSKDMLTGVLNRNEMNNEVDKLSNEDPAFAGNSSIGVIFMDLNGLKRINDELGHNAGDALLKDAARALTEVFPADCIYRAGGDEFTVILPGVTQEEVDAKIAELREASAKYENVVFAVGGYVESDNKDVRQALKTADERMYEDKRYYYETHPEIKKRLS